MRTSVSRRALLLGAAGSVVAGCGVKSVGMGGGQLVEGSFRSSLMRGQKVGWAIAYPEGHGPGDRLPVVVSLHGRDGTHANTFEQLRLGSVLEEVVADSVPPFALAAIDGGAHGYWHARADGTDPGGMIGGEFLPLLENRGLDTTRLGLYGWSMGGYGALLLAGREKVPVKAVAVSSPALFAAAGATPAGAFDDAEDFRRHDVYGHPSWLDGVALRVDCGRSDPFLDATRSFAARLRTKPVGEFGAGGHDAAYWRRVAPDQFRFLGRRL